MAPERYVLSDPLSFRRSFNDFKGQLQVLITQRPDRQDHRVRDDSDNFLKSRQCGDLLLAAADLHNAQVSHCGLLSFEFPPAPAAGINHHPVARLC